MNAFIGITASKDYANEKVSLPCAYLDAVRGAGGVPWVVPLLPPGDVDEHVVAACLDHMDGLLLSGGVDVAPRHFNEEPQPGLESISPERDELELALAREALRRDMPVLAICRGMQVLNIAAGGDVYQDLAGQLDNVLQHQQKAPRWHAAHSISVAADTLLHEILRPGEGDVWVNTLHHQAIRTTAPGFVVAARAPDGVVEAMESSGHRFILAVQWHPELMYMHQKNMRRVFSALIEAAAAAVGGVDRC